MASLSSSGTGRRSIFRRPVAGRAAAVGAVTSVSDIGADPPGLRASCQTPPAGSHRAGQIRHNEGVHAAAVSFDLHVPESRSLKAKRAVIRPIVDGLRHRFHLSVAETGHLDQWQRAEIGVAIVAATDHRVREVLGTV